MPNTERMKAMNDQQLTEQPILKTIAVRKAGTIRPTAQAYGYGCCCCSILRPV